KIRLKPEKIHEMPAQVPDMIKKLDVEVLHYFVIDKGLGIPREAQRYSPHLEYERNLNRCHQQVISGEADFAIITKGVTLKEVMEEVRSVYLMPPKSTYFYPKALSGLLLASIAEEDFQFPYEAFL